jgi:large subunit ribosomal protein L6
VRARTGCADHAHRGLEGCRVFTRRRARAYETLTRILTANALILARTHVQGPKGSMEMQFPDVVVFTEEGEAIKLSRANDTPDARKGHGLYRTLANNMMVGVSTGFEKKLKLLGVGYKAAMQGKNLNLSLGYSHPVIMEIPKGLEVKCDSNTDITVSGFDKVEVGNFAAIIRSKRPPEPYKGKGIRYADEVVIQKEGKRGK